MLDAKEECLGVRNLAVRYGGFEAISDVSLQVQQGKLYGLVGPNGAGKTTILRAISGLKRHTRGEIWFQGTRIDGKPPHEIARMGIAHVPQGRGIFPQMTVSEHLQIGVSLGRHFNESVMEPEREIQELYELFPPLKERKRSPAGNLSGGEAQMLAIARALAAGPKLLLMDEPLEGLGPLVIREFENILTSLRRSGLTILLVENNIPVTFRLSDWVYLIDQGQVVLQGQPEDMLKEEDIRRSYIGV